MLLEIETVWKGVLFVAGVLCGMAVYAALSGVAVLDYCHVRGPAVHAGVLLLKGYVLSVFSTARRLCILCVFCYWNGSYFIDWRREQYPEEMVIESHFAVVYLRERVQFIDGSFFSQRSLCPFFVLNVFL